MITLRDATAEDFRRYAGQDPDPELAGLFWHGQIAERGGELAAICVVSLDRFGRLWVYTDLRCPLPAKFVHRHARNTLAALKMAGFDAIHCYRNEALGTSERWLRRLGFAPAPEMGNPRNMLVWKCTLSTLST